jgi:hypothetical protein
VRRAVCKSTKNAIFFFFFLFFSLSLRWERLRLFFLPIFQSSDPYLNTLPTVVSCSSAAEVLRLFESDDALDIDVVLADASVRAADDAGHVFERIDALLKSHLLPVPPLVLVARDQAAFHPLRHVAACCLLRPVVNDTLAACLEWVVRRRILKQSMSDLLRERVLPVWQALVVSDGDAGDFRDYLPAAAVAAAATSAAAASSAAPTKLSSASPRAAKNPLGAVHSADRNANADSSSSSSDSSDAVDEPATRRARRRQTIDESAAATSATAAAAAAAAAAAPAAAAGATAADSALPSASAKEIVFSDSSSSSTSEAGDAATAGVTADERRGSVAAMLRRRMPSFSARARSRQGTDNAMILARVSVALTKALDADKLDDELRADFKSIVSAITKRSNDTPPAPRAVAASGDEQSSNSALETVASRSSDPATKEWLLSEYTSVEESFVRRSSVASFPSRKVLEVIATDKLKAWSFDPFLESEAALLNSIPTMFEAFELFTRFKIDRKVFEHFLVDVRNTYNANPYHNFRHAFDVTQTVFAMLTTFDAASLVTHVEILGLLLAAICHDLDHPGLNNAYQVRIGSDVALRYNDRSVLENYHGYVASMLLKKDGNNFLANLNDEQRRAVRAVMTTAILGTDVSDHFEFLSRFRDVMASRPHGLDRGTADDRLLVVQMVLKAADISNVCKPWRIARKWGDVLMDEFFLQGDREKSESLTPAVFMDRAKTTRAKVSINFIDYVAGLLFTEFVMMLPSAQVVLQLMASNRRHLLRVEKKQAKELGVPAMLDLERERQRKAKEKLNEAAPAPAPAPAPAKEPITASPKRAIVSSSSSTDNSAANEKEPKLSAGSSRRRKKRTSLVDDDTKKPLTKSGQRATFAQTQPLNSSMSPSRDNSSKGVRTPHERSSSSAAATAAAAAAAAATTATAVSAAAAPTLEKSRSHKKKKKKPRRDQSFSLESAASSPSPSGAPKQLISVTGGLSMMRRANKVDKSKSREV